ncbi:MAG: hypothetical protein J0H66_02445 [Solirubrobacterales bacterium]|nr:hypothetical protein [Solirubrobacterales bacterium]OJU95302.1 MAG: hypothetical protein BGO23_05435 [Solirubrobacterales bacterium 67-14]
MIRTRIVALSISCLLILVPAASAKKQSHKPAPPSRGVVVKLLKEHYLGDDPVNYPSATYTYVVHRIARGAARLGRHRADGTPPNRSTTVFPIHATSTRTVTYDGSKTVTDFDAKYVFFRDEFREWTFTIKSERSKITH